jgi:hypothetical protein
VGVVCVVVVIVVMGVVGGVVAGVVGGVGGDLFLHYAIEGVELVFRVPVLQLLVVGEQGGEGGASAGGGRGDGRGGVVVVGR